jgi:hypothetical protein
MKMAKATIEVDVYNSLDFDGLYSAVYFGDSGDDPIEVRTPWDEVIAAEIDMHTIPFGGPYIYSKRSEFNGVREVLILAKKLKDMAEKLEASIDERGVLLRDQFEDACGGEFDNTRRDEFVVKYEGYINELLWEK